MKTFLRPLLALSIVLAACEEGPPKAVDKEVKTSPSGSSSSIVINTAGSGQPAIPPPPAPADVAAPPADAIKTPSGLASKVLAAGTGTVHPNPWDTVKVNYTGWTTDGKMFDSSVTRGQPATMPLDGVVKGWTEGIPLMVVGEKRRLWIPYDLAYGEAGRPPTIPPKAMLVFDIELLDIKPGHKPDPAPPDVAAAPADAKKEKSGLATKVLTPGTGKDHPGPDDTVKVKYSAWTSDGKMFDSSHGDPVDVPVAAMPGWTEGIQQMVAGEKRRMWIPQELTKSGAGGPQGTLVFDVELVSIKVAPKPIAAPPDVKAAPADAAKLPDGLASKVITKGTGTAHPAATSTVKVHYTGWTTDGKMFDSSVQRGEPTEFPLNGVIKGWTEGVQLMVEGEKRRFWIPYELAYGEAGRPPQIPPKAMLVFEIELLQITKP